MALMHVNFFSNALGMCVACDVILPQKTAPEHGFKTLWLLHGMSDNHTYGDGAQAWNATWTSTTSPW